MSAGRAMAAAMLVALATAGCGAKTNRPIEVGQGASDWRRVATGADRARLRDVRRTWLVALAAARRADGGAIARDPALFDPDRAQPGALPPVGAYRCRVVKLGRRDGAGPAFVAYPFFECRIDDEGGVRSFYKVTGSQRPVGLLFPDGGYRAVFLGTLVLGDEAGALDYGRDANRDLAGVVTRIDARRWRIALPEPRFESKLDVIELVPAG